nr:leucine-rich repeat-containing protein kinase family protein [Herbaspirillum sp. ASV7]
MHTMEQLRSGALAGITRLSLSCGLREFPREIFTLADTLEILDLSGNELTSLPDDLPRLTRLRIVFCSDNPFTELPAVLGRCPALEMIGFKANRIEHVPGESLPPSLRWLVLTDNRITQLPASIGRCTRLQKLMLAGNRLSALPPELAACRNLELLRLSANALAAFPHWLLTLPRLSWLAMAGNPWCEEVEDAADRNTQVADIGWNDLQLGDKLGEGASGVIHAARWTVNDQARPVAVKLFKGAVTSDGLPEREMAACITAGSHRGLIPVLGRLQGHPQALQGLVMPLIAADFTTLAGPPSLQSCTRDVYAPGFALAWTQVLAIARDIASAAAHLHAQGIVHGDLYGHNILHREGEALLGDFGAAWLYDAGQAHAWGMQAMEVRAYGCLLEELLAHGQPDDAAGQRQRAALAGVRQACLSADVAARPHFEAIVAMLDTLATP